LVKTPARLDKYFSISIMKEFNEKESKMLQLKQLLKLVDVLE